MKDQKRFAALALSAVMVFSMAGSVSAAQKVESKDDLAGATIGVQLGTLRLYTDCLCPSG